MIRPFYRIFKLDHKLLNKFLIAFLLLTFTYIRLNCNHSSSSNNSCCTNNNNDTESPVRLKYAIDKLETMVEQRRPTSGLTMEDVRAAYEEKMNYTTWRKLMSQKVLDLFYDILQFTEGEKKSPLLSDKYKPTKIDEFESWYRKLRPYYFKAAMIELEEMLKELKQTDEENEKDNKLVE